MKTDSLIAHADNVGEIVGEFYGTPIREMNTLQTDLTEIEEAQQRVRYFIGTQPLPVEVLPGEEIKGNLIRRQTTAEVVGDSFYEADIPAGKQQGTALTMLELLAGKLKGVLITWRPDNQDFAILHEEVADELPA